MTAFLGKLFEPEEKCRLILQFLWFRDLSRVLYDFHADKEAGQSSYQV
jgi:hypothetical protein